MSDFGGRWSATLKNRGWSKKTEGRTRPKCRGGSLAVGTYLQRGSAPPPPPPGLRGLKEDSVWERRLYYSGDGPIVIQVLSSRIGPPRPTLLFIGPFMIVEGTPTLVHNKTLTVCRVPTQIAFSNSLCFPCLFPV